MSTLNNPTLGLAMEKCRNEFEDFFKMITSGGGNNRHMWISYQENSIRFAHKFLSKIEPEITILRGGLEQNSSELIELNDIIVSVSGVSCRNFCNMNGMLIQINPSEFKKNVALVNEVKQSIEIGSKMLEVCKPLQISYENRDPFLDNIRVWNQFNQLFKSATGGRFWGLF